jgi:hypothetical protein
VGARAVAVVALEELGGELPAVPRELVEALADHAHAARLGPGAAGLAAGQELTVLVVALPPGLEGACAPDGTICVRPARDPDHQELVILHELAHRLLDTVHHTHVDVWRLALALGAPRATVEGLARRGRLTALHLAAETGLPAWAAAWRLGAISATDSRKRR